MRIGELASRTGLTAKTIRFYEHAGLLPPPEREPSGYRRYDHTAVDRLRFVRAAQAAGLSLAEVRQVIVVREDTGPPCEHVRNLLRAHVVDLDGRISGLSALREEVRGLLERASQMDPASCEATAVCQLIPPGGDLLPSPRGRLPTRREVLADVRSGAAG
ncbi:heavy metal-responsive transcriptional regulator [Segeticoccus rhizosphaerae]|uniref:heavy metal-responsive transcriptional regulator n=1 Tax=Segeticoccus rhizosphaerae TaxID=1104777 RepID=UPI0010C07BC6|nr:heavy metal-responsive transcriptional regulator [Ornithinicoccus soli]